MKTLTLHSVTRCFFVSAHIIFGKECDLAASVSLCLIYLQAITVFIVKNTVFVTLEPRLEKMKKQREKPMWLDRGRPNLIAVSASKYNMSREGRAIAVIMQ